MAARAPREPDPRAQLASLSAAIAAAGLPRGVLLRGEERYFREAGLTLVADAAAARGYEICRHDAQDVEFDARSLTGDLLAPPMFASARCVLLRNASAAWKKESGDDGSVVRALLAFLADRQSHSALVVESESLRADHAVAKAVVREGGMIVSCRRLYDTPPPWDPDPRKSELVQWLIVRARELGVALDAQQAVYVATATGNDLRALEAALERLRRRGSQGLEVIVPWTAGASPFDVAEHMIRGDLARGVAGLETLFESGFKEKDGGREVDAAALVAMLLGSLRNKLRQSFAVRSGAPSGGGSPRALAQLQERSRMRTAAQWRRMQDDLADLEREGRSGATIDVNALMSLALRWKSATMPPRVARR